MLRDAEVAAVVVHPLQRRAAVVQAGRERVAAVLATAVAELDADDDETGGGQLVTPAAVAGAGGLEHHHAAAVEVQDAGQRAVGRRWGGGCTA